ncbi:MAG TPA: hypothetical protein VHZ30_02955 [Verrucomicrobiae bacterium]|jgi:hypothetical protein|nr:hypothetical protein [Verrucomicrobiae bacterium]
MSYPRREQMEVEEEAAPAIRILVRQADTNGVTIALNGHSKSTRASRSQRPELLALGWEARSKRLGVK